MKFVQTFWTGAATEADNKPLAIKAGWHSSEYHWMSWTMSCLQLLKLYGQVELVTDKMGKHILIDTLGLPYTSVSLALEDEIEMPNPGLFSLAKLKTYSLQKEPFIHVDGDLFLYQPLPNHIYEPGLISSNPEADLFFNSHILNQVTEREFKLPPHLKGVTAEPHLFSSNAGIIGGHDLTFIKEYCDYAFDFVASNKDQLGEVDISSINFLIEQISFFYLARQKGKPIAYVSEEPVTDPLYHDFISVADIPNVPMVHAVGGCKRFPFMLDHLTKRLRLIYPTYYYRILKLCKEQRVAISNSFYGYYDCSYDLESGGLSVKPAEDGFYKSSSEKPLSITFERTIKTLRHAHPEMPEPTSYASFKLLLESKQLAPQCKDILNLELLIEKAQLIVNTGIGGEELHAEDVAHYRKTDETFNSGMDVDISQMIGLSQSTMLYTAAWNWWKTDDEDMSRVLSENFGLYPDALDVAITPEVLTMDAYVYYLDELDAYIVNMLKTHGLTIEEILDQVRHAFEEEIDPTTNLEYRYLIFDTLKRLSFNRIITC